MADKKPVYNPSNNDDTNPTSSATAKASANTGAARAGSTGRKLGVGAIIGISAASLALLVGTSVAGSAITLAIAHNDRGHAAEAGHDGKPAGEGRDGDRDGGRDGGRDGQRGDGMSDGPLDGRTPHEHDANGNDIMPDGQPPMGPVAPVPTTTP